MRENNYMSSRRDFLRNASIGAAFLGVSGFWGSLASVLAEEGVREIKLILLGTGIPDIDPANVRLQASNIVEVGKDRWLVDAGAGATAQLFNAKISPGSINYFFITHLHLDHVLDVASFIWLRFMNQLTMDMVNRKAPREPWKDHGLLHVFGPTGTKEMVESLFLGGFRADARGADALKSVEIQEVKQGPVMNTDNWEVTTCPVIHAVMETRAFRLDSRDKSIVISADVGGGAANVKPEDNQALIDLAKGTDLLVFDGLHTKPEDVAEIARLAMPKKLVLTHLGSPNWRLGQLYNADALVETIKKVFPNEVIAARDLTTITV